MTRPWLAGMDLWRLVWYSCEQVRRGSGMASVFAKLASGIAATPRAPPSSGLASGSCKAFTEKLPAPRALLPLVAICADRAGLMDGYQRTTIGVAPWAPTRRRT